MLSEDERRVLTEIAAAGGVELTERDWELLALSRHLVPTDEEAKLLESRRDLNLKIVERMKRWDRLEAALGRGAFHMAVRGHLFGSDTEAGDASGGETQPLFDRFERGVRSLSEWNAAHVGTDRKKEPIGRVALATIEESVTEMFFPARRTDDVHPDQREQAQRSLLAHYEVPIDVDEFMAGNRVLIRERRRLEPGFFRRLLAFFRGSAA